jgi:hypothetical protein
MQSRGHITVATPLHSQNDNCAARKGRSHFRSSIFPLLSAACVFVLSIAIFSVHGPKTFARRGNFSRDILEEDRRFLDSLFEKTKCDDRTGRDSSLAAIQKIDDAGQLESYTQTVPRAMLVVNTEVVRRGQLVVRGEPVKHKRQNTTPWRRHAEVL